jgi:hypothetical protein
MGDRNEIQMERRRLRQRRPSMNTIIRKWHPDLFIEAEKKVGRMYGGKKWDQIFPQMSTIR